MCLVPTSQGFRTASGCSCGCCGCGCGGSWRRFVSIEEEREQLERYRDQLSKEMEGVKGRIDELTRCSG